MFDLIPNEHLRKESKIVRHISAGRHGILYVSIAGRADLSVPSASTPNKWSQTKRIGRVF
jgi:hypothetical protein